MSVLRLRLSFWVEGPGRERTGRKRETQDDRSRTGPDGDESTVIVCSSVGIRHVDDRLGPPGETSTTKNTDASQTEQSV